MSTVGGAWPTIPLPFSYARLFSLITPLCLSSATFFLLSPPPDRLAGRHANNVPQADKVITSFQPYADLWSLVGAVGPFITATARTPVTTLDANTVSTEHASMKSRCASPPPTPLLGQSGCCHWSRARGTLLVLFFPLARERARRWAPLRTKTSIPFLGME